jgi:hypothetical protein
MGGEAWTIPSGSGCEYAGKSSDGAVVNSKRSPVIVPGFCTMPRSIDSMPAKALGMDLDDLVPPVELPAIPKPGERLELTGTRKRRSPARVTVGSENPIGGGATAARLTVNQHSAERVAA